MADNTEDIREFYDRPDNVLREGERLERHQLERDLTLRYFEAFLPPPGGSVLEVGAATGVYTAWLRRRGYAVTAVDFSAGLQAECRRFLEAQGLADGVTFVLADGRDLRAVAGVFDAALLMGPMYHLVLEADRRQALDQALGRLRPGGRLFSAWIGRFGILGDLMRNVPGWIEERDEVQGILAEGRDPEGYHPGSFRGYFARPEEIAPFHQAAGLKTLALAAVEPAIAAHDESYNALEGEQRRQWLDVLYQVSQEPSLLGASRHLLYVGEAGAGGE